MKDDLHMDKMFREKFKDFSVEPPAHVWSNIQEQMLSRQRKKRMAYVGWISAAAIVVFAFIAGWMLNEQSKSATDTVAEQKALQERALEPTEISAAADDTSLDKNTQEAVVMEIAEPDKTDKENALLAGSDSDVQNEIIIITAEREIPVYRYLEARNDIRFTHQKRPVLKQNSKTYFPADESLPESERVLVAANARSIAENKETENDWILGAHLSPGFSAHSSNYSGEYSRNMGQEQTGGVSNIGGGISIQYKTTKRWSIESGIYYAQNSQSAGASNAVFSMPSFDAAGSGKLSVVADGPAYANNVSVTRHGIAMNSTAGIVNLKNIPEGAEFKAMTEASSDVSAATLITDGEFSQVFDLVEVPLYLRYQLLDKKVGIDVLGGLNAGFVVGNNAYIQNDFGRQNIGSTEDISTINVSGTVGVGVNYTLGRHFSLGMEPRVNYYLNSINTNPEVDYKPYRFGLFTGVYYTF
jgi:hypothetical protein